MSTAATIVLISAFVLMDLMVVSAVLTMSAGEIKSFAAKFPPVLPQIHAERRNFQSFGLGMLNCGWSFHVAADRAYVHLFPAWLFRTLGVPNFSIPRSELKDPKKCFGGVRVTVAGNDLRGPRWCLAPEMA